MKPTYLILNARLVNEGAITETDLYIKDGRIERVSPALSHLTATTVIDAKGKYLFPGLIDDQVHFREPGLTHKGTIYSESRAAVAGGITSYMEMPNTQPTATTQALLQEKYDRAAATSLANYSFFMGTTNHNLAEVLRTDPGTVCGIKIFMGSSTGDMLVNDTDTLQKIFSQAPTLIATHCENDPMIQHNLQAFRNLYGDDMPPLYHHLIRSEEACFASSSLAVELAKQCGTQLHILHISTARELSLFENKLPLAQKKITAEACIHHLWFSSEDYPAKGNFIKWNPSVKTPNDRAAILGAVLDDRIDVIATDHAPHTWDEKTQSYLKAPSGGPLVQHSLVAMLDLYHQQKISLPQIVEKMCHAPATLFRIAERGYVREGYWADIVLADLNAPWEVKKDNIRYLCGWSPFEGHTFSSQVTHTWVSGHLAFDNGTINDTINGQRLLFNR